MYFDKMALTYNKLAKMLCLPTNQVNEVSAA